MGSKVSSLGTISKKMLSLHDGRMAGSVHLETGLAAVVASLSIYLESYSHSVVLALLSIKPMG